MSINEMVITGGVDGVGAKEVQLRQNSFEGGDLIDYYDGLAMLAVAKQAFIELHRRRNGGSFFVESD